MYTVGLNLSSNQSFAITVRDLERSPHWQHLGDQIVDSRAKEKKLFKIMHTATTEKEARDFAAVIVAGYKSVGYARDLVKS